MNHNIIVFIGMSSVIQLGVYLLLKNAGKFQNIYQLSPKTHQKKGKTPSMGGVGMWFSLMCGATLFVTRSPDVWWLISLMTVFMAIGLVDDTMSLRNKENKGLRAWQKFGLQFGMGLFFLGVYTALFRTLSVWEFMVFLFIIVGTSNATNLTDGLDGLLTGVAMITCMGFYVSFLSVNHQPILELIHVLLVTLMIFLFLNKHPAKIFMGDTGSLAIGAGLAGLSVILGNPWVLIPLGAVYILETVSVILQVGYYKWKRKRIFLMSPLHHHFELLGMKESYVVMLFWGIQAMFTGVYIWQV